MIVQWLLQALFTIVQGVASGMAAVLPNPPTFWTDLASAVNSFWAAVPDSMKYFLPIAATIQAGVAYFAVTLAVGVLALVRRAMLSVLP